MHFRYPRTLIIATAVALFPATAVSPAQEAAASSLSSSSTAPGGQPGEDGEQLVVDLPGYGPYHLVSDLLSSQLDPNSPPEDLWSAAAFSADYEGNQPARDAALGALPAARSAEVSAGLQAVHTDVSPPEVAAPDAPIVVLGNGLNDDGSVRPNLENRLAAAEALAGERPQAPVVVSGGRETAGTVEAHAMRDWLIDRGISVERILVEDQSSSTVANARLSRQLVPEATSVIVVTSDNHVHRAVVDFTLAFGPDATVTGAAAPSDPPTAQPGTTGIYRDALNWYLG